MTYSLSHKDEVLSRASGIGHQASGIGLAVNSQQLTLGAVPVSARPQASTDNSNQSTVISQHTTVISQQFLTCLLTATNILVSLQCSSKLLILWFLEIENFRFHIRSGRIKLKLIDRRTCRHRHSAICISQSFFQQRNYFFRLNHC